MLEEFLKLIPEIPGGIIWRIPGVIPGEKPRGIREGIPEGILGENSKKSLQKFRKRSSREIPDEMLKWFLKESFKNLRWIPGGTSWEIPVLFHGGISEELEKHCY